jgi:hypothetical protein
LGGSDAALFLPDSFCSRSSNHSDFAADPRSSATIRGNAFWFFRSVLSVMETYPQTLVEAYYYGFHAL